MGEDGALRRDGENWRGPVAAKNKGGGWGSAALADQIGGTTGINGVGVVGSEEGRGKVGEASPAVEELQICINGGGDDDLFSCEHPGANDEPSDGGT